MERNPFKWPIAVIAGILVWVTEFMFNLPAALLWPTGDFSPFTNFHSDLGSSTDNSALGAQFYNSGQVFQGLAVILFAGGLYVLYSERKWKNAFLILGQLSTFLIGLGLIMNGVFSEDFQPQHGQWSEIIFYNIFIAEILVNVPMLFDDSKPKKYIAIFGLVAAGLNAFFVVGFDLFYPAYFLEWVGIYVAEAWLGLIAAFIFYEKVWKGEARI